MPLSDDASLEFERFQHREFIAILIEQMTGDQIATAMERLELAIECRPWTDAALLLPAPPCVLHLPPGSD